MKKLNPGEEGQDSLAYAEALTFQAYGDPGNSEGCGVIWLQLKWSMYPRNETEDLVYLPTKGTR